MTKKKDLEVRTGQLWLFTHVDGKREFLLVRETGRWNGTVRFLQQSTASLLGLGDCEHPDAMLADQRRIMNGEKDECTHWTGYDLIAEASG